MTTQEKTHTLELSEKELAAILFLMTKSNGKATYLVWKRCRDILAWHIDQDDFENKHKSLSEDSAYDDYIDYHTVEEEWEAFLGIGYENKDLLNKITKMEKELAELKEML